MSIIYHICSECGDSTDNSSYICNYCQNKLDVKEAKEKRLYEEKKRRQEKGHNKEWEDYNNEYE